MDAGAGKEPDAEAMDAGGTEPDSEDTLPEGAEPDREDVLPEGAGPDREAVFVCGVFCFLGIFDPACMGAAADAAPTGDSDAEGGATVCPEAAIAPSRSAFASSA